MAKLPGKAKTKRQPVHQRIAATLETRIRRDLKVGAKLPSETTLAAEFSVSTLTVREAVARLVQMGMVERRHGSGTYVADLDALRHVGILLNLELGGLDAAGFWLPLATQAKRLLETFGYRVRLYNGMQQDAPALIPSGSTDLRNDLENEHLLGLMVLGDAIDREVADQLNMRSVPVVGECAGTPYRLVTDYQAMCRQAVAHLASKGCQRVAILRWGLSEEACRSILREAALPDDPELVMKVPHPTAFGIGYSMTRQLLASPMPRPDGLVLMDQLLLPGVSFAVLEAGVHVPDELRLATHANDGAAVFSPLPALALVVSPTRTAEHLAGIMARLIRGDAVPDHRVDVQFHLEERLGGEPGQREHTKGVAD